MSHGLSVLTAHPWLGATAQQAHFLIPQLATWRPMGTAKELEAVSLMTPLPLFSNKPSLYLLEGAATGIELPTAFTGNEKL